MCSEKYNGERPEELQAEQTGEVAEVPAETVTQTQPAAETEETTQACPAEASAEEATENKLQVLLCTVKTKLAELWKMVWPLIQKEEAEEEAAEAPCMEEEAEEESAEVPCVEEEAEEESAEAPCVEEETEEEAAEVPSVEENVEETAEEETVLEQTAEEMQENDGQVEDAAQQSGSLQEESSLFADEEKPQESLAKKWKPLHLGLAITGGVVLLALLTLLILNAVGVSLKPRDNDVLYKNVYLAENKKLEKKADTVIATIGDKELTLGELQLYYINSVYSFYAQNQYYLQYLGLDITKPLDQQPCAMAENMTWEQYFLEGSIKSWQSYTLVELLAEQDGFVNSPEIQAQIDSMAGQLESIAVAYGYPDTATYLSTEMAPGVTAEMYLHFNEIYYVTNEYLAQFYEKDYPTDAEILIFHAKNRETFEANGIVPDMGLMADVRHILIQPIGGTVSEDGLEIVYTEEEWNTALSEAERILEAWKSGDATEESFATMANTYSADPGSNTTGGLYEAVDPFTNFVPEFLNWTIDMSRQPGDTEIIKTSHGYHIMYFVEGVDYFNYVVGEQLVADRIQTKLEAIEQTYPIQVNYKKIHLCEPLI